MYTDGIDVSRYQGDVQWSEVAADGIAFAYAKATEGATHVDATFATNWRGMKEAGICRGAYHFFRPAAEVIDQVNSFGAAVGAVAADDLPPMLDIEEAGSSGGDEWDVIGSAARVPLVLEGLSAIEQRLGRRPIVYLRRGFVGAKLPGAEALSAYPLWIAHYTRKPQPGLPAAWPTWTFWQHSDSGQIAGILGKVDLDRFNGSLDDLRAMK